MALERLDEDQVQQVLETAVARLKRVPRRGGERRVSRPHPTYVLYSSYHEPEHVGWEVLAFDADFPIALIEVAVRDGELQWVSTASGILPNAIVEAAYEAERHGTSTSADFGVVRVPQAGMSLLWLESGEFIPLRVPHLRNEVPDSAIDQKAVYEIIERFRSKK